MTTPTTSPDDAIFTVLMTPEHDMHATPTLVKLCLGHYLTATSCLMIRRVLRVQDSGECKFCGH